MPKRKTQKNSTLKARLAAAASALSASATLLTAPLAHAQGTAVQGVANETGGQLQNLVTEIVIRIPLWITAFIVAVISFILARMVKAAVENKMSREGFEEEHKELQIVAGRASSAMVLIVGITVALKIAGLDLTAVIAAGAFGLGFAMQDFIMNFIAGVMILTARHYTIGDVIKVNGTLGKIVEIQSRATVLKAFNGTRIVVPNAELFKNQVTSFTSNPFRRIQIVNGVGYGSDLKKAQEVVLEAIKNTPKVLAEPKPSVWFYEWGDYSVDFKANAWVESRAGWVGVRTQMIMNIEKALNDNNIDYPYPIQTLYLEKGESMENEDMQVDKLMTQKKGGVAHTIGSASQPVGAPTPGSNQPIAPPPPKKVIASTQKIDPEAMDGQSWLKKTSAMEQEAVTQQPPAETPAAPETPPTPAAPEPTPESISAPPPAPPNPAPVPVETQPPTPQQQQISPEQNSI